MPRMPICNPLPKKIALTRGDIGVGIVHRVDAVGIPFVLLLGPHHAHDLPEHTHLLACLLTACLALRDFLGLVFIDDHLGRWLSLLFCRGGFAYHEPVPRNKNQHMAWRQLTRRTSACLQPVCIEHTTASAPSLHSQHELATLCSPLVSDNLCLRLGYRITHTATCQHGRAWFQRSSLLVLGQSSCSCTTPPHLRA